MDQAAAKTSGRAVSPVAKPGPVRSERDVLLRVRDFRKELFVLVGLGRQAKPEAG